MDWPPCGLDCFVSQRQRPHYSDELINVDIGLNIYQVASYGNRYFHVYLQKLFMGLAPRPWSARSIFGDSWSHPPVCSSLECTLFLPPQQPLHGLIAVAFYFSIVLSPYCGVTSADIPPCGGYALPHRLPIHLRTGRKHPWPLVLLGALSFLSFKPRKPPSL